MLGVWRMCSRPCKFLLYRFYRFKILDRCERPRQAIEELPDQFPLAFQ